ncbi:polysaccharide biosynthesis tyrosine autokinase [candidate division KSB1 bacterium]|nr:polysaccharide biosynthesis tyrosine autokinase [candidate division KSB1 bacterium]
MSDNRALPASEPEQSTLTQFINIIFHRIWYILACLGAVLIPVLYYNQTATTIYEASTTIIYEDTHSAMGSGAQYDFYSNESIINQIQEIQSRAVALEVIQQVPQNVLKRIQLPEDIDENFDKTKFYAAVIKSNIKAAPVAESDVIEINVEAPDAYSAMTIANTLTDVLSNRNLRLHREEVSGVRALIEEQRQQYKERLETAENSLRQFKVKNRVTYLGAQVEEDIQRSSQIQKSYQEAKTKRQKTERNLSAVQQKISSGQENLVPSISDVSTTRARQLKERLADINDTYFRLKLDGVPLDNPQMIQMKRDIDSIQTSLKEEAKNIAESQNLIDPVSQISKLYENKITLELELESLKAEETSLLNALADYDRQFSLLPKKQQELAKLERERDLADEMYLMLSQRWEEARINEAEKIGNMRIIDRAELPKHPVWPRKRLNLLIGVIFGLTIGFGLAFFLESLDTSIKTPEEVERKTNLAIIGSIPRIRVGEKAKNPDASKGYQTPSEILITHSMPASPASEAYRTLRTNLQFSDMENFRTFMLTSSGPREGKSTTIANLAITTAQMGLKTLIIDADLRRPTIHKLFSLHRDPGLADILVHFCQNENNKNHKKSSLTNDDELDAENDESRGQGKMRLKQASVRARRTVQQIASLDLAITAAVQATKVDHLDILTCGSLPLNPSEMLASEPMRDLLSLVKEKYELIVIDAPPIIAVTDAAVLAPYVDGVALVIESGRNDKEIVLKAKSLLERVGVNLIGAVLNNVREKNLYGDYDYYYTYYSKNTFDVQKPKRRRV